MKKIASLLLAVLLVFTAGTAAASGTGGESASRWVRDDRAVLRVGNPTPMRGRFFTTMWGGTTSDLDVQDLLHACSPVRWDNSLGRFRFDRSVVEDAAVLNDAAGNRTYQLALRDDLRWSDGTPITAWDYAFSILLQMDCAVAETGGRPADFSWLEGSREWLAGEAGTVTGLRVVTDNMLRITMTADSLPYFYEMNRLDIRPCPAAEIAPGTEVRDDGKGVYLTVPLTAERLRETMLDEKSGYLSHPRTVSGPYVLESFDGKTAKFAVNPYYRGNEEGILPRIGRIEYTAADNTDMISRLRNGELDLLDKVTMAGNIEEGIQSIQADPDTFAMEHEPRTGLTMVWFMETSPLAGDTAVRRAAAYCFDRDGMTRELTGTFGTRVDGFYGIGQWMAGAMLRQEEPGVSPDGLTRYEPNLAEAVRVLEEAGWNLNEKGEPFDPERDGIRCMRQGETLTSLRMTMACPDRAETWEALARYLAEPLGRAGIRLDLVPADMETLQEAYEGRAGSEFDMIYLGENFPLMFDSEILAPRTGETGLGAVKEELYELACRMTRTDPEDTAGFFRKWFRLQQKITETLPLLPVYSNEYYDFFARELHNYRIPEAVTWGEAVVSAWMSDIEENEQAEPGKLTE